ncbi:hypothetical protein VPHD239_0105 [Vibrio phage D239]
MADWQMRQCYILFEVGSIPTLSTNFSPRVF